MKVDLNFKFDFFSTIFTQTRDKAIIVPNYSGQNTTDGVEQSFPTTTVDLWTLWSKLN